MSAPAVATPLIDGFAVAQTAGALVLSAHDATVDGPASEEAMAYLASWKQRFVGQKVTAHFDALGELTSVDAPNPQIRDQVRQRLLAIVIPIPDSPIGDSGQWRVRTRFEQDGIAIEQVAIYSLLSHADGKWKVNVHLERHAENQSLGDGLSLVGMFRTLDGNVVIDPTRLLPESGTLTSETRFPHPQRARSADREQRDDRAQIVRSHIRAGDLLLAVGVDRSTRRAGRVVAEPLGAVAGAVVDSVPLLAPEPAPPCTV